MKAILLSVKPQHLANILNGKKTIEVRKSKLLLNETVYLYCTKTIPYLYKGPYKTMHSLDRTNPFNYIWYLNNKKMNIDLQSGKVVAKCMFSEVIEYEAPFYKYIISNLEIFDTPKELGEFYVLDKAVTKRNHVDWYIPLAKAPKSWCYVEEMR